MTQPDLDRFVAEPLPVRRWQSPLTWSMLITLGFVAYELTSQPSLCAAVISFKFGWSDFQTALWLRRIDANRRRSWMCFCLYASVAWCKIAFSAMGMMAVGFPLYGIWNPAIPKNQLYFAFVTAVLVAAVGNFAFVASASLALVTACQNNFKLWLSPGIGQAKRENVWPGFVSERGQENWIVNLMATAFSVAFLLWVSVWTLVNISVDDAFRGKPWIHAADKAISLFVICGGIVMMGVFVLAMRNRSAANPWECWGDENWLGAIPEGDCFLHTP